MTSPVTRARDTLPLPRMLQRMGLGHLTTRPYRGECPFCGKKGGKFGVFESQGKWHFKCHNNECPANDPETGHNEIGFLVLKLGISERDAIKEFMKMASEIDPTLNNTDWQAKVPKSIATAEIPDLPPDPQNIWHDLVLRLPLTANHRDSLRKRGFSDRTIDALRYRSSVPANRVIIEQMLESGKWTEDQLLAAGVLVLKKRSREQDINPQLLGLGNSGKKDEDGSTKFDWVHPVLIPYLDASGIPTYIRPHKGGLSPKNDPRNDFVERNGSRSYFYKAAAGGHVYCPYLLATLVAENQGTCIVTEGEHKAAALWQARIPAVAIPGIQFARSRAGDMSMEEYTFRAELLHILREHGVNDVVICFDNEVKDNQDFPNFKADPWDRHDTAVWAEYLSIDLRDEFSSVRLGHIPDEMRIRGKADFDGVLAGFVNGIEGHEVFAKPLGERDGTKMARRTFLKLIDAASEKRHYHELFASSARRIIDSKLQRLFYTPLVACGGGLEETLSRRFLQINPDNNKPFDQQLATAFQQVRGCYYTRSNIDQKSRRALERVLTALDGEIAAEENAASPDWKKVANLRTRKAATWERIMGIPEPLSDFTLRCKYRLHTSDGKEILLVQIDNKDGRKSRRLQPLGPEDLALTRAFRVWGYGTGLCDYIAFGEKDLQSLKKDISVHAAYRDIHEVTLYGWHHSSKLWFYGDGAVTPDDEILHADAENIIWYEGIGYRVEAPIDDESATGFEQKAPLLLSPHGTPPECSLSDAELFDSAASNLSDMMGGMEAWLAMGIMLSFAYAPEMLAEFGGQPGLFLYGNLSEGKTTTMRLLMRLQGFDHLDGLSIEPTTEVAMARALSHYSCLAVWFDEFREKNLRDRPGKLTILRDSYNRGGAAKGFANDPRRTRMVRPNTTASITGESSSSDGATRSRFINIEISKAKRGENARAALDVVQRQAPHWHRITAFIMRHRRAFAARAMEIVRAKSTEHRDAIPNERVRTTHLCAFASFVAASELLGLLGPAADTSAFESFTITHAQQAFRDVVDETFLVTFWKHVVSGITVGEVRRSLFKTRVVIFEEDGTFREATDAELRAASVPGRKLICALDFSSIHGQTSVWMRKQNLNMPLGDADLRRSIQREKWCVPAKTSSRKHQVRFSSTRSIAATVISLEKEDGFPFAEELTELLTGPVDSDDHD